jgi:Mg2+/citrate symporter
MEVAAALIPSVGVGLLFYFAIRAILGADRNERAALAKMDREAAAAAAEHKDPGEQKDPSNQ